MVWLCSDQDKQADGDYGIQVDIIFVLVCEGTLPYWQTVCLSSLPPPLMADIEILGGFLGLRPSRPLGIFVCIDGKDCEKDALVG